MGYQALSPPVAIIDKDGIINDRGPAGLFYSLQAAEKKLLFMKLLDLKGAVAQMGERIPRTDEAAGSTPVCSTIILESRWNRSGGFSIEGDYHFPGLPA